MQNCEIVSATYHMERWPDNSPKSLSGVCIVTFTGIGRRVACMWEIEQKEKDKDARIQVNIGTPNLDMQPMWAHTYIEEDFDWHRSSMQSVFHRAIASWNDDMDRRYLEIEDAKKHQGQQRRRSYQH